MSKYTSRSAQGAPKYLSTHQQSFEMFFQARKACQSFKVLRINLNIMPTSSLVLRPSKSYPNPSEFPSLTKKFNLVHPLSRTFNCLFDIFRKSVSSIFLLFLVFLRRKRKLVPNLDLHKSVFIANIFSLIHLKIHFTHLLYHKQTLTMAGIYNPKKNLVSNILDFLTSEFDSPTYSDSQRDAIEVAIQCLESAFEVSRTDREAAIKIDLLSKVRATLDRHQQAEHHKHRGNEAMRNGDYELALGEYTLAIQLYPQNAVYFCNRAAAYSRLENDEDAVRDCRQALILDPNYGKAYGRLGVAYSNLNNWEESVRAYETAVRFDPENETYERNLHLARQRLVENMAPPEHRPIDISQFINNQAFLNMAQQMMNNPEFRNIMSGIMTMGQSGDTNFDLLLQVGQRLANQIGHQDPQFVEALRNAVPVEVAGPAGEGAPQDEENDPPAEEQVEEDPPADQAEENPPADQGEANPPAAQGESNPPAAQGAVNHPAVPLERRAVPLPVNRPAVVPLELNVHSLPHSRPLPNDVDPRATGDATTPRRGNNAEQNQEERNEEENAQ